MTMNELENLLGKAESQFTFDAGQIEWGQAGVVTSYALRPQEIVTPEQLREMAGAGGLNAGEYRRAMNAKLIMDSGLLAKIKRQLICLLQDHIDPDTGRIGHAFPLGGRGERSHGYLAPARNINTWSSPLDGFTEAIIKSAAILGPQPITDQLFRWLEGERVKYRVATVLNGVAFTDSLTPIEGIHLEPLPLSADELPVHLPTHRLRAEDFLGRTVLYADHEASPALFRPPRRISEDTLTVRDVAGVDFETVCQAISLESDTTVESGFSWNHYLGPTGLVKSDGYSSWALGRQRFELWLTTPSGSLADRLSEGAGTIYQRGGSGPMLSEQQLANSIKAVTALDSGSSTRMAITRWMRSRDDGEDLVNRFIDLRIALEALYVHQIRLSNNQGEIGLRLSLCGAWHLGADSVDRRNIRKKLSEAYGKASTAVHTGSIKSDAITQILLSEGQELCRRGIRKILSEGIPEDWMGLILGAEGDVSISC